MIFACKKLSLIYTTIAILLLPLLFLAGCAGDSPSGPPNERVVPALSHDSFVIPESDDLYMHHSEGDLYFLAFTAEPPPISARMVIAGTGLGGYIRRVISVTVDRSMMILLTGDAFLTDIVKSGEVGAEFILEPGTGAPGAKVDSGSSPPPVSAGGPDPPEDRLIPPTGGRLDLSGIILYQRDALPGAGSVVIDNGFIEFSPIVTFSMMIEDRDIIELHSSVEGDLRFYCEISADIGGESDYSMIHPLARFDRWIDLNIKELTLPLEARISYDLDIRLEGTDLDLCGIRSSIEASLKAGMTYCDNLPGGEFDSASVEFGSYPVGCAEASVGRVSISVIPTVTLFLFGKELTAADIGVSLDATMDIDPDPFWIWELSNGISSSCSFDPGILSPSMTPATFSGLDISESVSTGPYRTADYIFVTQWGEEGTDNDQFDFPKGVSIGPENEIIISDNTLHRIQVFTPEGICVDLWGTRGPGPGELSFPAGIVSGPGGNIYVVDKGNKRIQKFTGEGDFIRSWGEEGDSDGQFREPEGIAISGSGDIFVTDNFSNRVQKFSADGDFLDSWGEFGELPGQFSGPMGITCGPDGSVYVSECYNHRVQKFTGEGIFVAGWGTMGSGDGEFDCPVDLATGPGGNIHVVDYGNSRIVKFDPGGAFISSLGSFGTGEGGFDDPSGIAVAGDGYLYICDSGNHRIKVFAPLAR
ncbi:MAG: hypothetical protein JW814_06805 [Candidatus Krumholzibacteriota bacterium]|nr:hypothetical protein [Candidatus Krumholzibacteriota bacterium]